MAANAADWQHFNKLELVHHLSQLRQRKQVQVSGVFNAPTSEECQPCTPMEAIRNGADKHATRRQEAVCFTHNRGWINEMFEHFARNHDIERVVCEGEAWAVEVMPNGTYAKPLTGKQECLSVNVHTCHGIAGCIVLRQVPVPATQIQYILACADPGSELRATLVSTVAEAIACCSRVMRRVHLPSIPFVHSVLHISLALVRCRFPEFAEYVACHSTRMQYIQKDLCVSAPELLQHGQDN